ncbi:MAG: hypothetical protein JWO49_119 [Arthrobacter sp.]|nr:hypothetical protein [Arthrobacter sp.]MCU1547101.1 hypothetical protein [Arthrobacter sp.]
MTPATNKPQLPASAVHATPMRPLVPGTHRGAPAQHSPAQHPGRGRREPHRAALAEADYVGNPYCERCGTDEFLYLETFVPAMHRRDGSVSKLGEVTYFCSGCDDFSAHAVPVSWVPPGWYFG